MGLGVALMGGIASLYLETRKSQGQDEELGRLQENARYVLDLLKHEIAASGFLGGLVDPSLVTAVPVATDCSAVDWALDLSQTLDLVDDAAAGGAPLTASGVTLTCMPNAELQDDSDIILLKRTADSPTLRNGSLQIATASTEQWYLRSFDYSQYGWTYLTGGIPALEATAGSTYDYWAYYAKIFYVQDYAVDAGDGIPTLCEARLLQSVMDNRCLVEGVETLQFEIGVDDVGDDGVADRYVSAPTAADIRNAVAVRVHVLMRSINPIAGYVNEKAYQVGARAIDAQNDNFIRKVFTTTVSLRNKIKQ